MLNVEVRYLSISIGSRSILLFCGWLLCANDWECSTGIRFTIRPYTPDQ